MRTHHIAIFTRDLPRLEAFYSQALGLPVVQRWDDLGIVFLDAGGTQLELTRLDHAGDGTPHPLDQGVGINHIAFSVLDIDIMYKAFIERGARGLVGPQQYRALRVAFLADPDGNVLELVEE